MRAFNYIFNLISILIDMISQNKVQPTSPVRPIQLKGSAQPLQGSKLIQTVRLSTATTVRVIEEQVFPSTPKDNKYTGCNCSKSKCLKMYCACFSVGKMCDETCLCLSCSNKDDNMLRSEAINEVITKDPYAFSRKNNNIEMFAQCACNCKKSFCMKKYCECYRSGKKCGGSCQCHGCCNKIEEEKEERQSPIKQIKRD